MLGIRREARHANGASDRLWKVADHQLPAMILERPTIMVLPLIVLVADRERARQRKNDRDRELR